MNYVGYFLEERVAVARVHPLAHAMAVIGTKTLPRALYADLQRKYRMDIVASGGVSSMEDVRALRALGLYGAIIGKAVYTGDIDLACAIEEAKA